MDRSAVRFDASDPTFADGGIDPRRAKLLAAVGFLIGALAGLSLVVWLDVNPVSALLCVWVCVLNLAATVAQGRSD
jgi:hypothetical protein